MSELKAYIAYEADDFPDETEFYLKSEADKVLAEKDDEIAGLKVKLKVQTSNAEKAWKLKDSYLTNYAEAVKELYDKNKEIRHHKYKRCLAMAERCKYRMYYLAAIVEQEASKIIPLKAQIQWYQKRESRMDYWKNRWLELAEKFKEAK